MADAPAPAASFPAAPRRPATTNGAAVWGAQATAARSLTILTFHGIGPARRELAAGEDSTWLSTQAFEAILDLCADASVASDDGSRDGRPRPDGPRTDVAITFDDGNESDLTVALPALLRRRLAATFFIPAAALGRDGWLDATGVRTLVAAGMRIGSHGMHHKAWAGLDLASARVEMFEARDRLEQYVEGPVTDAACPFGAYDRRTLRRLRGAGYLHVLTSDRGRATAGDWLLSRNTVRATDRPADILRLLDARPGVVQSASRALRLAWKRWR